MLHDLPNLFSSLVTSFSYCPFSCHYSYFYLIADTMGTRAEIVASERRCMEINERLLDLGNAIVKNVADEIAMKRKQKRYELLRVKRSVLGQRIFGKSQMALKQQKFKVDTYSNIYL